MKNIVRLSEDLMERARAEAKLRNKTVASLLEDVLQRELPPVMKRSASPVRLPECRVGGGLCEGVDLDDTAALLQRMGVQR